MAPSELLFIPEQNPITLAKIPLQPYGEVAGDKSINACL